MLWIQEVKPDPGSEFFYSGSRIPIHIEELKYFEPKKFFPSPRKYDPGCSSRVRIPDPDLDFLPIPDHGSSGQKNTGSGTLEKTRPAVGIYTVNHFTYLQKLLCASI